MLRIERIYKIWIIKKENIFQLFMQLHKVEERILELSCTKQPSEQQLERCTNSKSRVLLIWF